MLACEADGGLGLCQKKSFALCARVSAPAAPKSIIIHYITIYLPVGVMRTCLDGRVKLIVLRADEVLVRRFARLLVPNFAFTELNIIFDLKIIINNVSNHSEMPFSSMRARKGTSEGFPSFWSGARSCSVALPIRASK